MVDPNDAQAAKRRRQTAQKQEPHRPIVEDEKAAKMRAEPAKRGAMAEQGPTPPRGRDLGKVAEGDKGRAGKRKEREEDQAAEDTDLTRCINVLENKMQVFADAQAQTAQRLEGLLRRFARLEERVRRVEQHNRLSPINAPPSSWELTGHGLALPVHFGLTVEALRNYSTIRKRKWQAAMAVFDQGEFPFSEKPLSEKERKTLESLLNSLIDATVSNDKRKALKKQEKLLEDDDCVVEQHKLSLKKTTAWTKDAASQLDSLKGDADKYWKKMLKDYLEFTCQLQADVKTRVQTLIAGGAETFRKTLRDDMRTAIMEVADKHGINPLEVRYLFVSEYDSVRAMRSMKKKARTDE